MFDYERYDHTYCRLTRDADEPNEKRRLSSASFEAMSDIDLNEHLTSNQVTLVETECLPPNREPVIIVRTKKPRKTAPSPIIVKAMDKDGGALMVSAVNTSNNSSLVNKNKIVSPAAEKVEASVEEAIEELQEETPVNGKSTEAKSSSEDEPPEPVIQTTKSGRPRKLTAKAKQISEESKASKNRKPSKAKPAPDKNSTVPKRSRGRPRKNLVVAAQSEEKKEVEVSDGKTDATTSSAIDVGTSEVQPKEVPEKESKNIGDKVGKGQENKDDGEEDETKKSAASSANKGRTKRGATQSVEKSAKKSKVSTAKPKDKQAPAKAPVKISNAKPASKRGRKPAPKLVIVTKPPPKRQATLRAEEKMKAARTGKSQSVAPAKVNSENNTKRNKRRRR